MGALQQYAHFEDTVNPLLVHPAVIAASDNAEVLNA
jgi:hypothetical protein